MSNQGNSQNHADRSGIHDILSQYRKFSHDELEKGKFFEKMIAQFLLTDPRYANGVEPPPQTRTHHSLTSRRLVDTVDMEENKKKETKVRRKFDREFKPSGMSSYRIDPSSR
jgi:predicted helicase